MEIICGTLPGVTVSHGYRISTIRYIRSNWVEQFVAGKCRIPLHRFNLECFLGRVLKEGEESDHKNHDRTDNGKQNLRPRSKLFQCNHRRWQTNERTGIMGVYFRPRTTKAKEHCVGLFRQYLIDHEKGTSGENISKVFGISQYGREGALRRATRVRKYQSLQDGMVI